MHVQLCRWTTDPAENNAARQAVLAAITGGIETHDHAGAAETAATLPPLPDQPSLEPSTSSSVRYTDDSDLLFSYMDAENATSAVTAPGENFLSYLSIPCSSLEPLVYWSDEANKKSYPELYDLHIKHHCIPATSANVERVFSAAGYIASARRNRLGDATLEHLVFAKCNKDKLLV